MKLQKKKEIIISSLQLPKDIVYHAAVVTILGNRDVHIENYRGILEYSNKTIVIQAKDCKICICGSNLLIQYYTNEDMKVSGKISGIQYIY
ncbi:MAG TPA: YabP/YqfC family sporulation protein [Lachnospiraceae bacterium]|nr:YabP/YqfC family sporulation protein [Lachnospiraceae bacterium]